ncbi:hypothetical protein EV424DRAFT_1413570 [Suillus variegatus]|nr:hypothetical protein EV424DRAFT_1413570 [Suillus variegatus]
MGLSEQVVSHFLLYYLVDLYAPRLVIYIIDLSLACTFLVFILDSSLSCMFIMICFPLCWYVYLSPSSCILGLFIPFSA